MKTNERDPAADRPIIRKVSRGYQITLPPEFREKARLAVGDHVRIEQQGDALVITAVSDERQRLAAELMAAPEQTAGASEIEDEEEAMRIAIEEIKRYRDEQRNKPSPEK